jgi:hypothetical protein
LHVDRKVVIGSQTNAGNWVGGAILQYLIETELFKNSPTA